MIRRFLLRRAAPLWMLVCSLGLILLGGCSGQPNSGQTTDTTMASPSIEEVLETHTDSLMDIEGVEGVGQALCDETPCIRIYASEMTPEIENEIPDTLDGYAIDVEVTGRIGPRSEQ